MAKKNQQVKRLTLRQRLRQDAEKRLDELLRAMQSAAIRVCEEGTTEVDPALLMQLASQPQHGKTLRNTLVTQLANEAEELLERLYNNQMGLPIEGDSDD